MAFRKGNELECANTGQAQRVVGNKVNKVYEVPAGWEDNAVATLEELAPSGAVLCALQPDTTLDLSPTNCTTRTYIKAFKRAEELVETLQQLDADQLQDVMGLGKKMAASHLDRFKKFEKLPPKQACLIFGGKALRADDWNAKEQSFAELHLRFVTGLYGVLRPYDDVKPVRDVPMGARIKTKRGSSLLEYWSDFLTKQLMKDLETLAEKKKGRLHLACAMSDEYWKAIQGPLLPRHVEAIQIAFEGGNEEETRRGRSLFGRYVVRKKIIFDWDGDAEGAAKEKKKDKKKKKQRDRSLSGSSVHSAVADENFKVGVIEGESESEEQAAALLQGKSAKARKKEAARGRSSDSGGGAAPANAAGSDSDAPPERQKPEKHRRGGGEERGGGSRPSRGERSREEAPPSRTRGDRGDRREEPEKPRDRGARREEPEKPRDRGDRREEPEKPRDRGDRRSRSPRGHGGRRARVEDSQSPPPRARQSRR